MPNRIFYAVHQVGIAPLGSNTYTAVHGLQSVGITTTFNLEQAFEIGQISLYQNVEGIPDVEVTLEKLLDGYTPAYLLATNGAAAATLSGRSTQKCHVGLSIFPDTQDAASGAPLTQVSCSGMVTSSLQWQFPVDGFATESITLVGNDKVWNLNTVPFTFSGAFTNTDQPLAINGSGGVQQRQNMLFTPTVAGTTTDVNGQLADPNCTILPGGQNGIPGISSSGTNDKTADGQFKCHLQRISVSTNLGREAIFELGRRAPYFRYATFPIEVTCEIECLSLSGDLVTATEAGAISDGVNLTNKSIRIAMKEGTRLNLGTQNKLASVTYTGGDAAGGNVSNVFSYSNFNDCTVTHWNDITGALSVAQGGIGGLS